MMWIIALPEGALGLRALSSFPKSGITWTVLPVFEIQNLLSVNNSINYISYSY